VGALLNIQDDHIGVDGINTLEEMAILKYEVLKRSRKSIVVNADDPLCMKMISKEETKKIYLVSYDNNNKEEIKKHSMNGGSSVYIEYRNDIRWIILEQGLKSEYLMPINDIPATMNGLIKFNEFNSLFAVAMAWAQNINLEIIKKALKCFVNSQDYNPGRYNFIQGLPYELILDYSHNPQGIKNLIDVAKSNNISGRKAIVCTIGNRFKHHLEQQIPYFLDYFDDIYISQDEMYFMNNSSGFESEDKLGEMLIFAERTIKPKLRLNQKLVLSRNVKEIIGQALNAYNNGDQVILLSEYKDAIKVINDVKNKFNA
jgi:cyanophycin synthetase